MRERPGVVALELDEGRLAALLNPGKATGLRAGGSFLAMMLLERFAGELTGSSPGSEMLRAFQAARAIGARVEFIDLPIGVTIGSLRKLPLGEKARLGVDSLLSMLLLPFGGFSLSKLTENMDEQLQMFRLRYPELSRILLDVREEYMVERIRNILRSTSGRVIALVGYGHMKPLAARLSSMQIPPTNSNNTTSTTGFTWSFSTGG